MPVLENARHERFAQGVIKGATLRQSYMDAGYEPGSEESLDASAARLRWHKDVDRRIRELQGKAAHRAMLSREDILNMLLADRELARDSKQAAAAIRATELLGKEVSGMFVDKKEIKTSLLDDVDAGKLEQLREALTSERSRRAVEGDGEGSESQEDRKVLSGPWPAQAGAIQKAS